MLKTICPVQNFSTSVCRRILFSDQKRLPLSVDCPRFTTVLLITVLLTFSHAVCHAEHLSNQKDCVQIVFSNQAFDENIVFSPYGVETLATMMALGAENKTFDEIREAFSFPENPDEIISRIRPLQQSFMTGETAEAEANRLALANGIWITDTMPLLPTYQELMVKEFKAHLDPCDFSVGHETNADAINAWVNNITSGKMPSITNGFSPETCMVLLNVINFRCDWLSPFDPEKTKEGEFTLFNGEKVLIPMMRQQLRCRFYDDEFRRCILLPYARDDLGMLIILPNDRESWNEINDWTSSAAVKHCQENMVFETVDCMIPKFALNSRIDMKPIFEQLGVQEAFDRKKADFSAISNAGRLSVDQLLQNVGIEVDESGTEAVAASVAVFAPKSPPQSKMEVMTFHADRPFQFAVVDMKNKICLFAGRYAAPGQYPCGENN